MIALVNVVVGWLLKIVKISSIKTLDTVYSLSLISQCIVLSKSFIMFQKFSPLCKNFHSLHFMVSPAMPLVSELMVKTTFPTFYGHRYLKNLNQ